MNMVTPQSQTKGGFLQLENIYEINYFKKNVAGNHNWTNGTKKKEDMCEFH